MKIAGGAGVNDSDASHRIFDSNTITVGAGGNTGQVGFQIQGIEPNVGWQQVAAGAVTITNDTFTDVAIPVRTVGTLTADLDWNDIFLNNGNVFTNGAALAYVGNSTTARAGTVPTDSTPAGGTATSTAIFASIQDAIDANGGRRGGRHGARLAGTYNETLDISKSVSIEGAASVRRSSARRRCSTRASVTNTTPM